jgi:MipA family protein
MMRSRSGCMECLMMKQLALWAAVFLCCCGFTTRNVRAEQLPLWEVGAGFAAIDFPVYRGSSERRAYLLPVPYLSYNGEFLKISRERARALFFKRDRVELDVSVNGSVPAKSSDTVARRGMPDLEATLEVGPSLNIHLYHDEDRHTLLDVRLPWRAAFATNLQHFYDIGWLFQPQLDLDLKDISHRGWNMGFVVGPIFADRRYHQYFYNVDPQYATPTRPAYTAHGGYSGTQFIWALSKRYPGYWSGGFMKWDDLSRAAFVDSPLVTSKRYFTIGWAITWILDRSDTMVEASDD